MASRDIQQSIVCSVEFLGDATFLYQWSISLFFSRWRPTLPLPYL